MSLNGSGVFSVNSSGQPVQSGTLITAAAFNAFTADVATALSTALYKDGQQTATANQPMGTYKHTNVGDATARTQYASAGQTQDGALQYLTGVSGTNTITAGVSPAPAAYAAGQRFSFIVGTTNTGAVTLNVSSLGAKSIKKKMSGGKVALVAADLIANQSAEVFYDGTDFILETARTYSHGADVESASTIDLDSTTGDCIDVTVTGITTITAITLTEGECRTVRFTGALTLTHGASLVLPTAANITTAAGDFAVFRGYASGVVRCVAYNAATGATPGAIAKSTLTTAGDMIYATGASAPARLAVGTAYQVLRTNSGATAPEWAAAITLGTATASTSGKSVAFSSIPATVRRVTVMFNGVSTNGTSPVIIQIGNGTVETSGYLSGASSQQNAGTNAYQAATTGFMVSGSTSASSVMQGAVVLTLEKASSNTWIAQGSGNDSGISASWHGGGSKSLSAALTALTITTVSGASDFNAGEINISYE